MTSTTTPGVEAWDAQQHCCYPACEKYGQKCSNGCTREAVDIDQAVNRFLAWRLPKDFSPDCGISFKPGDWPEHLWPVGTNLLNAVHAKAMLEHVLAGFAKSAGEECSECRRLTNRLAKIDKALDELGAPKHEQVDGLTMELSRVGRIKRIAQPAEVYRKALVTIRDECFSGAAHDIAEAALNEAHSFAPSATLPSLEKAASLIRDAQPIYAEDKPLWHAWCLDARAWLHAYDNATADSRPASASDARPWSKPMTVTDTMLAAAKHAEPKVGRDAALRIYRAMIGAADSSNEPARSIDDAEFGMREHREAREDATPSTRAKP